jgi:2-succinyl-5-enolpyruvyl-6-hydroxy-3-cyclohexene-1-carboxylate synthase
MHTYLIDYWQQFNDDCPNFIQSPINTFCQNQISEIDWKGESDWTNLLLSFEREIAILLQSETEYSEASIARVCHESLKDGDQLIIGSSMPIRDIDMFTSVSGYKVDSYANRGASGIDGVISTALGISAANNDRRSLLLLGDLSFYHDMNGFLASKYDMNLTIVVINNRGGGIFSFLPIANSGMDTFSQYWTTDTGLDLEKVARLYNCQFYKIDNLHDLRLSIQESFNKKGIQIIEVKTQINDNVKAHQNFMEKVGKALTPS